MADGPPPESPQRQAAAVYGTVLVLAVVAALSKDKALGAGEILAGLLASTLVYWLAHLYADTLARRATGQEGSWRSIIRHAAAGEWPLVEAALAPALPLLLGTVGVLDRGTAVTLSIAVALADLVGWGYTAGRRSGLTRAGAAAGAMLAVALGGLMVVLKNLLH